MPSLNRSKTKITALVALIYIPARLLFNSDGDPSGAFHANAMLYANAGLTLLFALVLCSRRNAVFRPFLKGLFGISFSYYSLALVSAAYSGMPAVTAYQALTGLLFTFGSIALGRMIEEARDSLQARFQFAMQILLTFSIVAVITNALYFFIYFGVTNFITHGIPSDFVAVLLLFYVYAMYSLDGHVKWRLTKAVALVVLALFLKSFSAIATFFIAFFLISLYERKFARATALLAISAIAGFALYQYAVSSIGQGGFMGKPAEAYLTGSGRFGMYGAALDVFFNDFSFLQVIFGGGFMAERVLLMSKDLPWITDPHNSIILSGLGIGAIGLTLYLLFAIQPFLSRTLQRRPMEERKYVKTWLFFHIYSLLFGLTSSFYMGRPSYLAIFSLTMLYVLYSKHRAKSDNKDARVALAL